MIELQTGLPGGAKSLYTIDRIEVLRQQTGRPVFYVAREQSDKLAPGIVGLTLPWTVIQLEEWSSCPPGSIVVIDECQKVPGFRPRPTSQAAPVWAEPAMETHRGDGIDLILICQHPSQLHVGIRRLVGRHLHAVRKFGFSVSTIHEWGAVKDNCDKSRTDSIKSLYKFNKKVYSYYKSSEEHTHKAKLPAKVWGLLILLFAVPALGFLAVQLARGTSKAPASTPVSAMTAATAGAPGQTAAPGLSGGPGRGDHVMTPLEYAQAHQPRIDGLPHTAPVYDEVSRPQQAPYPAACIASKSRCGCWTQQGTRLDTPEALCRSIAGGGFFVAWAGTTAPAQPLDARPHAPGSAEPSAVSLGGDPRAHLR